MADGGQARRVSLGAPGVRALVIGTGSHVAGSVLPAVPAAGTTAADLGAALTRRCGLDPSQVRVLTDPDSPAECAQALHEAAAEATDVLVFAYIGHGLGIPGAGLYLATHSTAGLDSSLIYQALSFDAVRHILDNCRARSIVVLLDCCFAGLAQGAFRAAASDRFAAAQADGGYLLTASAADEVALAPAGQRHTACTGALIDLLENGDPAGPPVLTIDHAFGLIERTLLARQQPRPWRYVTASGGEVILAANPAYTPPGAPEPPMPAANADLSACPYRGLSAYQPRDASRFFGREDLTAALADRLARHSWQHGPLMLLGASGAGKSSLLGAGLVPALHDGRVPLDGSWSWRAVLTTPGAHPLDMLTARLADSDGTAQDTAAASPLLLIIDQFEELFTECPDPAERAAFARALREACQPGPGGGQPRALAVAALRADFYQECIAIPELAAALEHRPMIIGPMTSAQLRTAIEGPARAAGLVLETGLADRLLQDLGTAAGPEGPAGSLPLLSHALMSTWRHRSGPVLTLAGYQASGGIANAVEATAEGVYHGLDSAGRRAVRPILLSLVRIGDSAEDTRGRVPLADVLASAGAGQDTVPRRVVNALVSARLVDVGRPDSPSVGPADGVQDTVGIAHEALLRAWPRLRDWISQDRAWLLARQSLGEAARAWAGEGRDPSGLYRGPRLAAAAAELADRRAELPARDIEFLDASLSRAAAERRATRRRSLLLRGLSASLAVALAVVAGVVAFVVQARHNNAQLSRDAASQRLAALSDEALHSASNLPYDVDLRALAAWQTASTSEARSAILSAQMTGYAGLLPDSGSAPAQSLAATSNGRLVAAGDAGCSLAAANNCGKLRVWDTATRREVLDSTVPGGVSSVAFAPGGAALAVTALTPRFQVQVWNMQTMQPEFTLGAESGLAAAYSPDGSTLAVASVNHVVLWNVATRTAAMTLPAGQFSWSLAFSPDGRLLAAGANDGTVRLWDTTSGRLVKVLAATKATLGVRAVAFSPDGSTLAATSGDGIVRTWHTSGLTPARTFRPAIGTTSFDALAFSPDGREIVAGGDDSQIYEWDTRTGSSISDEPWDGSNGVRALAVVPGMTFSSYGDGDVVVQRFSALAAYSDLPIYGAAIDARSGLVATGGADGDIRLWTPGAGGRARTLTTGSPVQAVAFGPDGSITAGGTGQLTVRDLATGKAERVLPLPGGRTAQARRIGYSAGGAYLVADVLSVLSASATSLPVQSIDVWDTRTWRLTLSIPDRSGLDGGVLAFALAPAGAGLPATGLAISDGSSIQLWDLGTGKQEAQWSAGSDHPTALAFVPGSHTLITGDGDGTLTEWDTVSHRRTGGLLGAASAVRALAVSPDGSTVAVSGQDPAINLYSLHDRSLLATLQAHDQQINSLVFSQDSTHLLSSSNDGTALWWDLEPPAAVRTLCQAVSGSQLAASWRQLATDADISLGPAPC